MRRQFPPRQLPPRQLPQPVGHPPPIPRCGLSRQRVRTEAPTPHPAPATTQALVLPPRRGSGRHLRRSPGRIHNCVFRGPPIPACPSVAGPPRLAPTRLLRRIPEPRLRLTREHRLPLLRTRQGPPRTRQGRPVTRGSHGRRFRPRVGRVRLPHPAQPARAHAPTSTPANAPQHPGRVLPQGKVLQGKVLGARAVRSAPSAIPGPDHDPARLPAGAAGRHPAPAPDRELACHRHQPGRRALGPPAQWVLVP